MRLMKLKEFHDYLNPRVYKWRSRDWKDNF
jgi:hypothetical protein